MGAGHRARGRGLAACRVSVKRRRKPSRDMSKAAQLLDEPEPLHRLPYLPLGLKETRYGNMIFLPHDHYIGRSIIQLGEFSYGGARLIEQSLGPGMTALDVGARIGTLTLPMVKAVGKTGRVLAFEPQIVLYLLLCANMALNNVSRIACYRAVGKQGRKDQNARDRLFRFQQLWGIRRSTLHGRGRPTGERRRHYRPAHH